MARNGLIRFTWNGKNYKVDRRFQDDEDCILPTGEVVTYGWWDESSGTPIPREMHLSKCHQNDTQPNETAEQKAIRLRLQLAEEDK